MRRFYREVSVAPDGGGYGIRLDGKPIMTPAKAVLRAPTAALAERIGEEWRIQGETIAPLAMPLTQLLNTALDRVPGRRREIVGEIAAYGATDLLCYRATYPPALVERQGAAWDPPLDWLAERHGIRLEVARGLEAVPQEPQALARIGEIVGRYDDFRLSGLYLATGLLGSVVLALALAERRLDAAAAYAAALVEELYQVERWGGDKEAVDRLQRIRADIEAADEFLRLAVRE